MGLANPDHVMVHDACLLVRDRQPERYLVLLRGPRVQAPARPARLAGGETAALATWPTPAIVPHVPDEERKRHAIWCYTSQIPPLERDHALTTRMEGRVPEQFWRLAPPPEGWEGLADFI